MNRWACFLMGVLCNLSAYATEGDLVWGLPDVCQKDEYKNEEYDLENLLDNKN